jgi:hypothetical protein
MRFPSCAGRNMTLSEEAIQPNVAMQRNDAVIQ